jgi:hypothetical protein
MPEPNRHATLSIGLLILLTLSEQSIAGDISGAPASLPPHTLGDFSFILSNNFFSLIRDHEPDEYRTQQTGIQFDIVPGTGIVIDYSILTAGQPNPVKRDFAGIIDQISLSIKHELYHTDTGPDDLGVINAGAGIRSYGDFGGNRIQGGFHRLTNNDVDDYPYVDTETTMAIFWLNGNYQKLYELMKTDDNSSWKAGLWLAGTALVSTQSQWDASVSASALARHSSLKLWLGLRQDWRENYESDFVQESTAISESGTSLTFGIGSGPIVFETAQGLGDKLSYSRLTFTSFENEHLTARHYTHAENTVALNILLPDVEAEIQYRRKLAYRPEVMGQPFTSLVLEMHYGEPTYQQSFDVYHPVNQLWPIYNVYSDIQQLAVGVEFEWYGEQRSNWIRPYLTLLAGQRTEQLKADEGTLAGQQSEKVSSMVAEAGTGIKIRLYTRQVLQFDFEAGIIGYYPLSTETVDLDQYRLQIMKPGIAMNLGFSVGFGS